MKQTSNDGIMFALGLLPNTDLHTSCKAQHNRIAACTELEPQNQEKDAFLACKM